MVETDFDPAAAAEGAWIQNCGRSNHIGTFGFMNMPGDA